MASIQLYTPANNVGMVVDRNGAWVMATDHAATVAALDKKIAELESASIRDAEANASLRTLNGHLQRSLEIAQEAVAGYSQAIETIRTVVLDVMPQPEEAPEELAATIAAAIRNKRGKA